MVMHGFSPIKLKGKDIAADLFEDHCFQALHIIQSVMACLGYSRHKRVKGVSLLEVKQLLKG